MSDILLHSVDDRGIATLTMNKAEVHNAFDEVLIAELTDRLQHSGGDANVRAVVLRGAGKSFSAGADLGWMRRQGSYSHADNLKDAQKLADLMKTLNFLPKPTIAVIQGVAYGGGVGLAACADIVIAAERATFCLSEVKLGIIPGVISPYVVSAIGHRHARRYAITAELISATEAYRLGLVSKVCANDMLDETLETMLQAICQGATGAQADIKDLLFQVAAQQVTDSLVTLTAERIAARRASAEGKEGLSAFLDRREPAWR